MNGRTVRPGIVRVVSLGAALLVGAAPARAHAGTAGYQSESSVSQTRNGGASITGQAFVILIRGEVTYAAYAPVYLYPVGSATTAWYEALTKHGRSLSMATPEVKRLGRKAVADDGGRFEFTDVAPGDYYLISQLTPGFHTGYAMLPGGIVLHNEVRVGAGECQPVQLTAQVQPGVGLH